MEGFIKITATPQDETTTHLEVRTDLKQVNKVDKAKLLQLFMKATEMDTAEALYLMMLARRMESEQEAEENSAEAAEPDEPASTCDDTHIISANPHNHIGKYCVIRGDRSGVFAGTLVSHDGQKVVLHNVRRLWRWYGATECLQIAMEGVKCPEECRFTMTADTITLLDAIEIIPTTAEAEANIKAVPVWKM